MTSDNTPQSEPGDRPGTANLPALPPLHSLFALSDWVTDPGIHWRYRQVFYRETYFGMIMWQGRDEFAVSFHYGLGYQEGFSSEMGARIWLGDLPLPAGQGVGQDRLTTYRRAVDLTATTPSSQLVFLLRQLVQFEDYGADSMCFRTHLFAELCRRFPAAAREHDERARAAGWDSTEDSAADLLRAIPGTREWNYHHALALAAEVLAQQPPVAVEGGPVDTGRVLAAALLQAENCAIGAVDVDPVTAYGIAKDQYDRALSGAVQILRTHHAGRWTPTDEHGHRALELATVVDAVHRKADDVPTDPPA